MSSDLGLRILESIKGLDEEIGPLGLYGSERGLVFTKVIYPAFKRGGYRVASWCQTDEFAHFEPRSGDGKAEALELVSVSKIKVRCFGNRHRVDLRVRHESRWPDKKLQRLIGGLGGHSKWNHPTHVIFLGFASEEVPFFRELADLHHSVDWDKSDACYQSLHWRDPHGRGFFTRACFWGAPPITTEL